MGPPDTPPRPTGLNTGQLAKQDDNNNNNNNPPASPSEQTTTTCSVSTANDTTATLALVDQRRRLEEQIRNLGIASTAAASGMAVVLVPMPIMLGSLVVLALMLTTLFRIYQRVLLEYQAVLQGRGFGQYLPASVYNQLVNMSLHEWMTDSAFMDEWQFLALYFVPGVSAEQLDAYINRLVPRHQTMLRRPGLGHLLGSAFMRLIVGDEGLANLAATATTARGANVPVPRRLTLTQHGEEPPAIERLGEVERGALPSTAAANENATAAVAAPQSSAADDDDDAMESSDRGIVDFLTGGDDDDEDDDEEEEENLSEELNIIVEAMTAAITSYRDAAYQTALGYATDLASTVTSMTTTIVRTSLSVGIASVGIGLFGIAMGYWEPPSRLVQRFPGVRWEQSNVLFASSLASGVTAGLVMFWPGSISSDPPPPSAENGDDKKAKKTKQQASKK